MNASAQDGKEGGGMGDLFPGLDLGKSENAGRQIVWIWVWISEDCCGIMRVRKWRVVISPMGSLQGNFEE